jgi:pimeloyl-ACP methyl ester carboxylesterase
MSCTITLSQKRRVDLPVRRLTLVWIVVVQLGVALLWAPAARAQDAPAAIPGPCEESTLASGARTKICVPTPWNGQLVVFAHGYVPNVPGVYPLDFYDTLPDGTELSTVVQGQGFAYATTSYRQNGLAILEGIDDVRGLVALFESRVGKPLRSYLAGASEGALVTALLVERFPTVFTGAYATCGPIGSFRYEIDYLTDFRVLFDYFFPGLFEGNATHVTPDDVQGWLTRDTQLLVQERLLREPKRALELLRTAKAAYDPKNLATVVTTTLNLLQYNILGASDLQLKLGGSPYDNRLRWYFGSTNDLQLNRRVARFAADLPAVLALKPYETTGNLRVPMVTLHTTADDVAPFTHEVLYFLKARPSGRGRLIPLPVFRYGHCAFTVNELLTGLGVLLLQP